MTTSRWVILSSASVILSVSGTTAKAQDVDARLVKQSQLSADESVTSDEIIVTASRRAESAQSVPIAISQVSGSALDLQAVTGLQALPQVVPGLQFSAIGPDATPFLRGVGNNAVGAGVESSLAMFVDGVYVASQLGAIMDFNNIANIEVAKGPQGTLFGRNATAGVILITTRTPKSETSVDASLGYGNYGTYTAKLYATTGLGKNLAGDIAVSYRDQTKGWGTNLFSGKDAFTQAGFGVRSKLLWTPVDELTVTFAGDYARSQTQLGAASHLPRNEQFLPNGETEPNRFVGDYNVNTNVDSDNVNKTAGGSLTIDYRGEAIGIKSISSYRWYQSRSRIDADLSRADLIQVQFKQVEHAYTQEILLSSPDHGRFKWIAGVFYYVNDGKLDPFTIYGSQSIFVIPSVTYGTLSTKSISGFGQATYAITPSTNLTGGLRYTTDRRKANGQTCGGPTQLFGGPVCILETDQNGVVGPRKRTFSRWTWKAGVDQKLGPDAMIYASYSRGFKSGFFNLTNTNDVGVDPEILDAYEVGLKSELFDRRLRFNVSAFYYDYSDLQVQTFQGTNFVVRNAAKARIKGVDFDLSYRPISGLTLGLAGQYLDAKYKAFPAGPIYTALSITAANPPYGFGGYLQTAGDLSGNYLVNAPKWTLNGTIQYSTEVSFGRITALFAPRYRTRLYFDPANQGTSAGFFSADATLRWESSNDRLSAQFWMNNVTDARREAIANVTPEGTSTALLPPRTYGLTLGYKF